MLKYKPLYRVIQWVSFALDLTKQWYRHSNVLILCYFFLETDFFFLDFRMFIMRRKFKR